jgi:hypothetical protein
VVGSLGFVSGATALAFGAAIAAQHPLGLGTLAASVVAAIVIALAFAWRLADGLATFGVVVLLAGSVEYWAGVDLRLLDEAALPVLVGTAGLVHRGRLGLPRPGPREAALLVLLGAGLASTLANAVPIEVWVPGLALAAKGFVFFYLTASLRLDAGELRALTGGWLLIGSAIGLVGFLQFMSPELAGRLLDLPAYPQERGSIDVVNAVFTHPAIFGWLCAFMALFLYARFAVVRNAWLLLGAVVFSAGVVVSGRRTPVIGLFAAIGAGALREGFAGRASRHTWGLVAASVVVLVAVSLAALGTFYRDTLRDYVPPSDVVAEVFADEPDREVVRELQARVALYAGSMAVARDEFPLGAGIGRYASHMSREAYSPVYAEYGLDNVYGLRERRPIAVTDTFWPMILGETGIIGLLATITFFALLARDVWRAAEPRGSPAVRAFTLGALLVLVEGLVRSLASPAFVAPPITYFLFGVAGLALALTPRDPDIPSAPPT